jgi:SAM-dependent methyltransferase
MEAERGLVRFLRDRRIEAFGFDVGEYADRARTRGIQILMPSELAEGRGSFDIVSLIEVLEHFPDPVSLLQSVRELLRPGGLLFLTTGNADPHRRTFPSWGYVIPEIHVSYFSPESLGRALNRAGLQPYPLGRNQGLTNIIKYKILKSLRRSPPGSEASLMVGATGESFTIAVTDQDRATTSPMKLPVRSTPNFSRARSIMPGFGLRQSHCSLSSCSQTSIASSGKMARSCVLILSTSARFASYGDD